MIAELVLQPVPGDRRDGAVTPLRPLVGQSAEPLEGVVDVGKPRRHYPPDRNPVLAPLGKFRGAREGLGAIGEVAGEVGGGAKPGVAGRDGSTVRGLRIGECDSHRRTVRPSDRRHLQIAGRSPIAAQSPPAACASATPPDSRTSPRRSPPTECRAAEPPRRPHGALFRDAARRRRRPGRSAAISRSRKGMDWERMRRPARSVAR